MCSLVTAAATAAADSYPSPCRHAGVSRWPCGQACAPRSQCHGDPLDRDRDAWWQVFKKGRACHQRPREEGGRGKLRQVGMTILLVCVFVNFSSSSLFSSSCRYDHGGPFVAHTFRVVGATACISGRGFLLIARCTLSQCGRGVP